MERAGEAKIKSVARAEGLQTLREEGMAKALAGFTSVEEVVRVTVAD